ncbi:NeuD/PglB/VioB family sugar acetyltransferase [Hydrogenimonas cancrithermarum]|uniref:Acetyltransferase n=1 Tax=Hydrogenimonas cancrithermarum TaxID=2993563 RepID=A0ABM8FME1_9BACT|nr:NeuD/PglB/VioB family sugar acetyltransferase [Hydrogenimonas cancrithermarum]BDY13561.1 acetyltransferase [Hydrogenimonas cancrithermarum]
MNEKLILAGGGGHCKAVIDVVEKEGTYTIAGILDRPEMVGETVLGYEIVGTDSDIPKLAAEGYHFLVTVGQIASPKIRIEIFERIERHTDNIATVVSPLAYVSPHAEIGRGSVVMHHALINAGAMIGENCIVNSKALVEHDATVEAHCHISTGAILNGGTLVRIGTFIGSNAVSKEYVETKPFDFIKAGTLFKGHDNG